MAANTTSSIFDLLGLAGAQFTAMIIGAVLASAGGFFVAWLLDRMERKRQERSIALVCLDLLNSLGVMTQLAQSARGRGDPYGPVTLRLVRGCQRDLDVYERNRERIADIGDPAIRAEIYQCMARMALTIDGILGETDVIVQRDEAIAAARARGDAAKVEELTAERLDRCARRDSTFDFMIETINDLSGPLSAKLRTIAKSEGQSLAAIVAANTPPPPPPPG